MLVPRDADTWAKFPSTKSPYKIYTDEDEDHNTASSCSREESPLTSLPDDSDSEQERSPPVATILSLLHWQSVSSHVHRVLTSYDPQNGDNKRFPALRDRDSNNIWTESARADTCNASKPMDLQELESTVSNAISTLVTTLHSIPA